MEQSPDPGRIITSKSATVSPTIAPAASASTISVPKVMLATATVNWQTNLGVRPKMIFLSMDGDGSLFNLDWLNWTYPAAHGSGSLEVRCWNNPPHVPDPACPGGGGVQNSFLVPVKVALSNPVYTVQGWVFSKLSVEPDLERSRFQYFGLDNTRAWQQSLATPPLWVTHLKCQGSLTSWSIWLAHMNMTMTVEAANTYFQSLPDFQSVVNSPDYFFLVNEATTIKDDFQLGQTLAQVGQNMGPQIYQQCQADMANGTVNWPRSAFYDGMQPLIVVNGRLPEPNPNAPGYDLLYLDILNSMPSQPAPS